MIKPRVENVTQRRVFALIPQLWGAWRTSTLRRSISRVYGGDMVAKAIGVVTSILLIRVLVVEDYAAYVAFCTVMCLFPGLIGGGVNLAMVRFSAEHISRTGERPFGLYVVAILIQMLLYLLLAAVLLVFAEGVSGLLFGEQDFVLPLRLGVAAGFGYALKQAGRCVYQAEERFDCYIKVLWLRQVSVLVLVAALFLLRGLGFARVAAGIALVEMCVACVVAGHVFRGAKGLPAAALGYLRHGGVSLFFASTGWLMGYIFLLTCFQSLDVFMLSHFSVTTELAIYGVAFRYYGVALMLLASIHAVLRPHFSTSEMQDVKKQRDFARKWLRVSCWLLAPIMLGALALRPAFILVNGPQYEAAFRIFMVFTVGIWISLSFSPMTNVLMSRRAFHFLVLLAGIALTVNAVGNYLLIPKWGGMAAAAVTVASHAVINISAATRVFVSSR